VRDPHEPARSAASRAEELAEALPEDRRQALRASIQGFLIAEPERDENGLEIYLGQIEIAIRSYLVPSPEPALSDRDPMDRESLALEFDSVSARARSLRSAFESLSAYSRDRLTATTRLDRAALDHLLRLCNLTESEAARARQQMIAEPGQGAPAERAPELLLMEELAVVWTRHTDERIARDREARSPWSRFVEITFGIAGIEITRAHALRVRAFDSAGLDESSEMLESVVES